MTFDRAHNKRRVSVGFSLKNEWRLVFYFDIRLKFSYMNNVVKYRALIIGLNKSLELNMTKLQVFSDSKLMVIQTKKTYRVKNSLTQY